MVSVFTVHSKDTEKISEFLQEMQELGIGEPSPLLVTNNQDEVKVEPGAEVVDSDNLTDGKASPLDKAIDATSNLCPLEKELMSEWVPLGLSFGIPLFSQEANAAVCDKVCLCVPAHMCESLFLQVCKCVIV